MFENLLSLYRLVVRTLPFHGNNTGSSPVRDNLLSEISYDLKYNNNNLAKYFKQKGIIDKFFIGWKGD